MINNDRINQLADEVLADLHKAKTQPPERTYRDAFWDYWRDTLETYRNTLTQFTQIQRIGKLEEYLTLDTVAIIRALWEPLAQWLDADTAGDTESAKTYATQLVSLAWSYNGTRRWQTYFHLTGAIAHGNRDLVKQMSLRSYDFGQWPGGDWWLGHIVARFALYQLIGMVESDGIPETNYVGLVERWYQLSSRINRGALREAERSHYLTLTADYERAVRLHEAVITGIGTANHVTDWEQLNHRLHDNEEQCPHYNDQGIYDFR